MAPKKKNNKKTKKTNNNKRKSSTNNQKKQVNNKKSKSNVKSKQEIKIKKPYLSRDNFNLLFKTTIGLILLIIKRLFTLLGIIITKLYQGTVGLLKNLVKRPKEFTVIIGVLAVIIFATYKFLVGTPGEPIYGKRLDDIPTISNNTISKVKNLLEENDLTKSINIRVEGAKVIINLDAVMAAEKQDVEKILGETLEEFNDEIKSTYDINYYVYKSDEQLADDEVSDFPFVGTKTKNSQSIVW